MKHVITSMNTKKALSASLKKFMEQKKISKISVSEINSDCGFNRKTFYYHFEDIYTLLKWAFEQETLEVLKNFDLLQTHREAIAFIIDYYKGRAYRAYSFYIKNIDSAYYRNIQEQ